MMRLALRTSLIWLGLLAVQEGLGHGAVAAVRRGRSQTHATNIHRSHSLAHSQAHAQPHPQDFHPNDSRPHTVQASHNSQTPLLLDKRNSRSRSSVPDSTLSSSNLPEGGLSFDSNFSQTTRKPRTSVYYPEPYSRPDTRRTISTDGHSGGADPQTTAGRPSTSLSQKQGALPLSLLHFTLAGKKPSSLVKPAESAKPTHQIAPENPMEINGTAIKLLSRDPKHDSAGSRPSTPQELGSLLQPPKTPTSPSSAKSIETLDSHSSAGSVSPTTGSQHSLGYSSTEDGPASDSSPRSSPDFPRKTFPEKFRETVRDPSSRGILLSSDLQKKLNKFGPGLNLDKRVEQHLQLLPEEARASFLEKINRTNNEFEARETIGRSIVEQAVQTASKELGGPVAFRDPGKATLARIGDLHHFTKSMDFKSKTAAQGSIVEGFVPREAGLSKATGSDIEKFNQQNHHLIEKGKAHLTTHTRTENEVEETAAYKKTDEGKFEEKWIATSTLKNHSDGWKPIELLSQQKGEKIIPMTGDVDLVLAGRAKGENHENDTLQLKEGKGYITQTEERAIEIINQVAQKYGHEQPIAHHGSEAQYDGMKTEGTIGYALPGKQVQFGSWSEAYRAIYAPATRNHFHLPAANQRMSAAHVLGESTATAQEDRRPSASGQLNTTLGVINAAAKFKRVLLRGPSFIGRRPSLTPQTPQESPTELSASP